MARLQVGKSTKREAQAAAEEAVGDALRNLVSPALAIVLTTDHFDAQVLATSLDQELGKIPWVGCSSAGVFVGPDEVMREGLAVGVLDSSDAYVGIGIAGPISQNPRNAGAAAVARALDQLPAMSRSRCRMLLVLLDALSGHGEEVVRGAVQEGGMAVAWAGGGAGDNVGDMRFVRSTQFARGRASSDTVVVAALDLPGAMGRGIEHGWVPYGPPTLVTRARGELVVELEYEPAFEVYRQIARTRGAEVTRQDFAAFAAAHPLGIPQADGKYVIRDPLAVLDDGSLRCVSEVPDGSLVRVMSSDQTALLRAAQAAGNAARAGVQGALAGSLIFDCVSRYLLLDKAFGGELKILQAALGPETPMLGCLTFGEVGSLGAIPQFHNKTCTVLALPA